MRSWLMTVAVLVVLIVAFSVFLLTQQTTAPGTQRAGPTDNLPGLTPSTKESTFQAGDNGWVQTFDKKTGELVNEFRAEHFDPPINGRMHVVHAESRLYEKDGRVILLQADHGDIQLAEGAKKSQTMGAMPSQPPSNGLLYDCTLSLFEADTDPAPVLTCKVPIVRFDNDTLQLKTVEFQQGNTLLPADQVPVVVRGRDYDFDGRGLFVRYNQRDRRLEQLKVYHGQRLLIKNPKNFGGVPLPGGAAVTVPVQTTLLPARPSPDAMAQAEGLSGAGNNRAAASWPGPSGSVPLAIDGRPIELVSADPNAPADAAGHRRMSEAEREKREKKRAATQPARGRPRKTPATKPVATKPAATKPVREPFAYVATFYDNVRLKEGDAPIGTADRMVATFAGDNGDHAATQPGGRPTTGQAATPGTPAATPAVVPAAAAATSKPADRAARRNRRGAATRPATAPTPTVQPSAGPASAAPVVPAAAPATGPAPQPIEVTWTGPLEVVPKKMPESDLKSPADRLVQFTGKPVHLQRQGSTVDAAYVRIGTQDNRFTAAVDEATPVVTLHDAKDTVVTTRSVVADGNDVTLLGDSTASFVLPADDNAATQPAPNTPPATNAAPVRLVTTWSKRAIIHLTPGPNGNKAVDAATLYGDVDVQHPQVRMKSQTMALAFKPSDAEPNAQPQLSAVHASDGVTATVTGNDGAVQTIAGRTLDLGTAQQADGKLALRTLHSNGDVVVQDEKQVLATDDLSATLAAATVDASGRLSGPATQPGGTGVGGGSFAIDTLFANGHVNYHPAAGVAGGTSATADTLNIDRENDVQWLTLAGVPATVRSDTSTITGGTVRVTTDGQQASIPGPGTLVGSQQAQDGKPGHPIRVVWDKSLAYHGADNKATVLGNVIVTTHGDDGATNTARGQTLDIVLTDPPATQPTDHPATQPTAGVQFAAGGPAKRVKEMTLSDEADVEVKSVLAATDAADTLVRQMFLYTKTVNVQTNPDGSAGAVTVPGKGRILYTDVATKVVGPATRTVTTAPAATQPSGTHGIIAMEWTRSLVYDPAKGTAVLEGDVHVVDRPPGQAGDMQMLAPRVVAEVATGKTADNQQVKKVTASEGAVLVNAQVKVEATTADFDPSTSRVVARGTPRQPVIITQQNGISRSSADEIVWNMKTNQPDRVTGVSVEANPVGSAGNK